MGRAPWTGSGQALCARRERSSRLLSLFDLRRPAGSASSPSFPRLLPRAAARLALAALLLAGAGTVAAPASAATLVSNISQTAGATFGLSSSNSRVATKFTTGDNADGYTLSSVDLVLGGVGTGDDLTVTIRAVSSDDPGAVHATLTNPTLANGTKTFTAPSNTTLAANTTYWVDLERVSGTIEIGTTSNNSEDAASASGWSIANLGRFYGAALGGDEWQHLSGGRSLRFTVTGTAKSSTTTPTGSVWSATLTVKNLGFNFLGCSNSTDAKCSSSSVLTDDDFTHDSTNYAITELHVDGDGDLKLTVDTDLTTASQSLTLDVAGTKFSFGSADVKGTDYRTWDTTGLSWSADDEVAVSLTPPSTNTAPTASDGEVTTDEDVAYTFAHGDFNFSDTDSDDTELASVKVVTLPGSGKGTLKFDGTALAAGDLEKTVTKAELDADKLTYEPPADANGNDYTTFTFKVNDGDDDSADTYTMTIDVDSVPDVTQVAVTSTPQSGSSPKKYGAGETIQVTVTFDETVTVTDDPHVEVEVGTNTRDADYASGSESMALVFEYTVVAADADSDGIAVNADVMLDTDSSSEDYIRDGDDNDADVTFTALGAQSDHKVDGSQTPPALGLEFSTTSVDIFEGDDKAYNLRLDSAPAANVTVAIASGDTGAATVSPSSRTFTTSNWNSWQQVTVTGVQDNDKTSETVTITHSATGVQTGTVTVRVFDDEADPPNAATNLRTTQWHPDHDATLAWDLPATQPSGVTVAKWIVEYKDGVFVTDWLAVHESATAISSYEGGPSSVDLENDYEVRVVLESTDRKRAVSAEFTLQSPSLPTNLRVDGSAARTTVPLTWDLATQPSAVTVSAVVVQQAPSGGSYTDVLTLAADATSATVTGLTPATGYDFRVVLETNHGRALSNNLSVTTLDNAPPAGSLGVSGGVAYGSQFAAFEGDTLTAVTSGITDENGLTTPNWRFQWYRIDTKRLTLVDTTVTLSGATGRTYTVAASDVSDASNNKRIYFTATYTDDDSFTHTVDDDGRVFIVQLASDATVTATKNEEYTFSAGDFSFVGVPGTSDALAKVKIVTVETAGDLKLDGTAVTANTEVTKQDLDDGKLTFEPAVDATGAAYATFTFEVSGTEIGAAVFDSNTYTMTIDVRLQATPSRNNLNIRMEDNVPTLRDAANRYNYVYLSEDGTGHCKVGEDPNRAGMVSKNPVVCPATKTYGLRLKAAPPEDVIVTLSSEDPDAVDVSPKSVTFTPSNWNDYQNITVSAVADSDGLEEHAYIYHESEGAMAHTVRVAVTDTDTHTQAGHSLVYSNDTCHCLFVQPNTPKEFTVRLRFEPEDDTWITFRVYNYYGPVTGGSGAIKYAGIKVSPARVTFTPDNWETPQTFTVVADSTYTHTQAFSTGTIIEDRSTTGVVMGLKPYWKQKTYPYTTSPDFRITVGSGTAFSTNIPFVETIAAEAGSQAARLTWALHEDDTDEDLSRWKVRHGEADDAGEVSDWGDWSTIPGSQRDTRSHVVTGLANDTRYGFQVMPVAGDTDGFESDTATATPEAGLTLSAPGRTDLFVDGGDAQAAMSWNGLSFGGTITGWQYRYGEHNRHNGHTTWLDWTDIGDAAATSHTVTDLVNDRDYAFQVRAMAGGNPGDMSEVQTAYVYHPLIERFVAAEVTDTSVGVEWGLPEGVEVTALRARHRVPEGEWQSEELALDATGHTFTGLDPETRYNFQVVLESETGGTETGILVQATNSDSSVITGFTLVNASTDADIGALGASVTATRNGVYGIRAEVAADADIGSIVMQLSGEVAHSQTESVAPYSLYGDRNNREHGRALGEGTYTISATAYAEPQGQGDVIGTRALTFTVAVEAAPSTPVLTGFVLLDTSDQSTVAALSDGAEIDLGGRSGGSFAIRADVASDATVGSVALSLSGAKTVSRTENLAPYSLYGDHHDGNGGRDLDGSSLPAGTYTLSATAYAERRATGSTQGTLSVSFEVLAPAALSVADAEAEEGTDATLDFEVTLDREAAGTVMVDYATENGTAPAGSDYTTTSGTLTFQPGEREKTVSVPVLDDDTDEGSETLTLRLTNAEGATIADGEATGTITNSDPIPQAWLARFGRTVTGQVLDAVEARLASPREAGAQASLAGQALPSWRGGDAAGANDDAAAHERREEEARAGLASVTAWLAQSGSEGRGTTGFGARGDESGREPESRALTPRDLIVGTSFALTGGSSQGGGYASLWGRGSIAGFNGRDGDVTVDGEVTTGLIGADWASADWTAGLALGHSTGTGGWRKGGACDLNCGGAIEATLSGVYPFAGLDLTERLTLWAAAGYGAGEVTVTPEGEAGLTADLTLAMGAAGLRSEVLRPVDGNGLALAVKGDARFTRTSSDAVRSGDGNLAASEADVWLLRTGVEGSRPVVLGEGGATLTPSFEVGLRLDGGDAETGMGADLGGGVAFADSKNGLSLDMKARGLVAHEAPGFREWGASLSGAWDPRPQTGRGLSMSLRQSWGAAPSGGMDALLGRETLAGLAANDDGAGRFEASSRLDAELGYGWPAFGGGFTGTPNIGFGLSDGGARDWRIGWRLAPAGAAAAGFEMNLDATRSEPANDADPPVHGVMLRGAMRW